jgi:hypothetical protein
LFGSGGGEIIFSPWSTAAQKSRNFVSDQIPCSLGERQQAAAKPEFAVASDNMTLVKTALLAYTYALKFIDGEMW